MSNDEVVSIKPPVPLRVLFRRRQGYGETSRVSRPIDRLRICRPTQTFSRTTCPAKNTFPASAENENKRFSMTCNLPSYMVLKIIYFQILQYSLFLVQYLPAYIFGGFCGSLW
jgi:hypothetical protein